MSYTLGNITLPRPSSIARDFVEIGSQNTTLNGVTKKDIRKRKEQFVLGFQRLSQSEVSDILTEYNLETTRDFEVDETNLTISATSVHIEIRGLDYNTPGSSYRTDLTLILTEES